MKRGKEALKELYNFEGFSFSEICKENSVRKVLISPIGNLWI